jgi:general secretion pathway protein A
MYTDYFGLAENPFRLTPDPRFLWYSEQHLEAKEKMLYHIRQSAGPILLVAEVGTGKTTLARRILQELEGDQSKRIVFVFSPKLTTTNAFLRFVMDEFGVKTERSYGGSLRNFERFISDQYQAKVSPVLIVDEAQNMTRDMLLLIQHLFNYSTHTQFLIQMAMFAQPDITARLKRLRSLKSRLRYARLNQFDLAQTQEMMKFRWTVAGGSDFPFEADAVGEIYRITAGVPRSIVNLANEALMKTALTRKKKVTREIVLSVSAEADLDLA